MLKNFMKKILDKRHPEFISGPQVLGINTTHPALTSHKTFTGCFARQNRKGRGESGFTLAEVLITLGIIGVVAAMTIPTLIANYQKTQTVSQLKKDFSAISQATEQSEINNGPSKDWDWGDDTESIRASFNTYWAPYLKILKYCNTYLDCNYPDSNVKDIESKSMPTVIANEGSTTVLLQDGSMFRVRGFNNDGVNDDDFILIDINGPKKPNIMGKDIFEFSISQTGHGIIPIDTPFYGPKNVDDNCAKVTLGGELCAKKIIEDGWQIKDDYPWN